MKKLGWIGKLQYNIYYHFVATALKKVVKEVWKSISLPPFCCSTCIQTIIFRYNFDITVGFSLSLYFANQIRNLSVKTLKVCLVYPNMLALRALEAYFASLSLWSLQKILNLHFSKERERVKCIIIVFLVCL